MKIPWHILLLSTLVVVLSCRKESSTQFADAAINLSEDTIHFDTLFTDVGSVTQYFKLYNGGKHTQRFDKISLSGGANSHFHINVDGVEGPEVTNAEVGGRDSLYVFVSVKIDPNATNLPFLVEDSIAIAVNGVTKWVQLQAWGQNANFIRGQVITGNRVWTNTKPYVVIGGLRVAETGTLTIQPGTKIYLHADAPIIVDGSLRAFGDKYDSTHIIFRGDRLDESYRDFPGSWPGIFFRDGSFDNVLEHVEIRNAYQGLVTQGPALTGNPKLLINSSIVDNCYDAGIIAVNSDLVSTNTVVSNCGKNLLLLQGGNYSFKHLTNVSISNLYLLHKDPVLSITDYFKEGDVVTYGDMKAEFVNSIFWGENSIIEDEVVSDKEGSGSYQISFTNCLWKIKTVPSDFVTSAMVENKDPLFLNIDTDKSVYDFRLQDKSPAIGIGIATDVSADINGNPRNPLNPDAGAFESGF